MEQQITNNQIAVMFEELRSKFDVMIESQMSVSERLTIIEAKVDTLQRTIDQHTIDIDVIKTIVKQHSIDIDSIKTELVWINKRLDRLEKREEYGKRVAHLETRVATLEKLLKK